MPDFTSTSLWIGLLTLTLLEIVLGVDNIIFLSIVTSKLPKADQPKARNIGLLLAMGFRIGLLFGITWIMKLDKVLIPLDFFCVHPPVDGHGCGVTGQGIILLLGGLFLLYKATKEIHHKLEGDAGGSDPSIKSGKDALTQAIIQITIINIVFSFDSILTAVGIADDLFVMIVAVIISVGVMMAFSGPVSNFVNDHPTVQMLGLAFLILIGFSLVAESAHLSGVLEGEVPKGYLYFAIFFSLFVEMLNIRMTKKRKPIQLHGYAETAKNKGLLDDNLLDDE